MDHNCIIYIDLLSYNIMTYYKTIKIILLVFKFNIILYIYYNYKYLYLSY